MLVDLPLPPSPRELGRDGRFAVALPGLRDETLFVGRLGAFDAVGRFLVVGRDAVGLAAALPPDTLGLA
jgi:hypothetical protein